MDRFATRVHELGYGFPATRPERLFDHVKVVGDLAYVSGHGPLDARGHLVAVGPVPSAVSIEQAYEAGRWTAANCLGSLKSALGSLERVEEMVKVLVFVYSDPGFYQQPLVANGFTDLLVEVFGERGRHARSAIGVSSLPNGQSVEVEMIARIRVE